ncbi:MAG: hypothetical protein RLT87_04045 [Gammaproteobacteria bacterium]
MRPLKRCDRGESTGLDSIMSKVFPSLPNIEFLVDDNGEISIGAVASIPCAAIATDEARCLAMLVRREGERRRQLLIRLDRAIEIALEDQDPVDEINNGDDERL